MSQLGAASMTFAFNCDCTYESRARFLLMSVREKGSYWVEDGKLFTSRASGEITTWPFRFDGEKLVLEESEAEMHAYQRKAARQCSRLP